MLTIDTAIRRIVNMASADFAMRRFKTTLMELNMRYTFGTNEIAARRLEKVARIFNPHSAEFIREYVPYPVVSAVDMGCGPGFTTHLLNMTVKSKEIYGMDSSEAFLHRAMDRFSEYVFVCHDLTRMPFPLKPEVMYVRFVLSHMPDPVALVNDWTSQLNERGALLIEEVEDIKTDVPVFKRYLEINKGLVGSQRAALYVGKELSRGAYDAEILANRCVEVAVSDSAAAEMFYPNTISIWRDEPYVTSTVPASERKDISCELREIIGSGGGKSGITWKMRRIVLRNREQDPYLELFI
ncbi:MAG: class I SAM-dependent methyltransferase [Elusimicrobiota bacterium]